MHRILFICGSLNQTTMMHQIALQLGASSECHFAPYYLDGVLRKAAEHGWLDFTIAGGNFQRQTRGYLQANDLSIDERGEGYDYDLVVTCNDNFVQNNIRHKRIVLVQEGMTEPEDWKYHLVRTFGLPRYIGNTATAGLSDAYEAFFVASEGYRDLFIRKGVRPEKIRVTGIPNFDNCAEARNNDFPHKHYVLVATSDTRETFKYENRRKFIEHCVRIADGRQLIFKLHPNEKVDRAVREINQYAPGALVFPTGNTNAMIANCDVLITRFSTVVYVGIALGKEVYSEFDVKELYRLAPIQNDGTSARLIATQIRTMLEKTVNTRVSRFAEKFTM